MSLRITNSAMSSDQTRHVARLVDGGWELSWLPGRLLDRNQAITGMTIAETVTRSELRLGDRMWFFLTAWAAELDLTAPDAIARARQPRNEQEGDR